VIDLTEHFFLTPICVYQPYGLPMKLTQICVDLAVNQLWD